MIVENQTPAYFGLVAPASSDDALCRMAEMMSGEPFEERMLGSIFASLDQLKRAFIDSRFFIIEKKKPILNIASQTYQFELTRMATGEEWLLVVNVFGGMARIQNCVKTGQAKTPIE